MYLVASRHTFLIIRWGTWAGKSVLTNRWFNSYMFCIGNDKDWQNLARTQYWMGGGENEIQRTFNI